HGLGGLAVDGADALGLLFGDERHPHRYSVAVQTCWLATDGDVVDLAEHPHEGLRILTPGGGERATWVSSAVGERKMTGAAVPVATGLQTLHHRPLQRRLLRQRRQVDVREVTTRAAAGEDEEQHVRIPGPHLVGELPTAAERGDVGLLG